MQVWDGTTPLSQHVLPPLLAGGIPRKLSNRPGARHGTQCFFYLYCCLSNGAFPVNRSHNRRCRCAIFRLPFLPGSLLALCSGNGRTSSKFIICMMARGLWEINCEDQPMSPHRLSRWFFLIRIGVSFSTYAVVKIMSGRWGQATRAILLFAGAFVLKFAFLKAFDIIGKFVRILLEKCVTLKKGSPIIWLVKYKIDDFRRLCPKFGEVAWKSQGDLI